MLGAVMRGKWNTVKCWFYVPGIYIFLLSLHIDIDPAKSLWRTMLNFPWIYVWLHTHFFDSSFILSIKWQFAVLSIGKQRKKWFSVTISCLLYCLCIVQVICCVQWSNSAELETLLCSYNMAARPRPVLVALPGCSPLHSLWHGKMLTACVEWIRNGFLQ